MPNKSPAVEVGTKEGQSAYVWAGCAANRPGGVPTTCCQQNVGQSFTLLLNGVAVMEAQQTGASTWRGGDVIGGVDVSVTVICLNGVWYPEITTSCSFENPDPTTTCCPTKIISSSLLARLTVVKGPAVTHPEETITYSQVTGHWTGGGVDLWCDGGTWKAIVDLGAGCVSPTTVLSGDCPIGVDTQFLSGSTVSFACSSSSSGFAQVTIGIQGTAGESGEGGGGTEEKADRLNRLTSGFAASCGPPVTFTWPDTDTECLGLVDVVLTDEYLLPDAIGTAVPRRAMGLHTGEYATGVRSGTGTASETREVLVVAECVNVWHPPSGTGTWKVDQPVHVQDDPPVWRLPDLDIVGRSLAIRTNPLEYVTGVRSGTGTASETREAWYRTCCEETNPRVGTATATSTATGVTSTSSADIGPPPPPFVIPCCPPSFEMPGRLFLTFVRDPMSGQPGCKWFGDLFGVAVDRLANPPWLPPGAQTPVVYRGFTRSNPLPAGGPPLYPAGPHYCTVYATLCTPSTSIFPVPAYFWAGYWVVWMECATPPDPNFPPPNQWPSCGMQAEWFWDSPTCRYRKFLCRRPVHEVIGMCPNGRFVDGLCPPNPSSAVIASLCDGLTPNDAEWPGYALNEDQILPGHPPVDPPRCCPNRPDPTRFVESRWAVIIDEA